LSVPKSAWEAVLTPEAGAGVSYEMWISTDRSLSAQHLSDYGSFSFLFYYASNTGMMLNYTDPNFLCLNVREGARDATAACIPSATVDTGFMHITFSIAPFVQTGLYRIDGDGYHRISTYLNGVLFQVVDFPYYCTFVRPSDPGSPYGFFLYLTPITWGEFRVYNRTLSSTEAVNNYAATVHRYHPELATTCPGCPLGSRGTTDGLCGLCSTGYYNTSGTCTACPAGQFLNNTSGACASCISGTFAGSGSTTCTQCSAIVDPFSYCLTTNGTYVCIPPTSYQPSRGCECATDYYGPTCALCPTKTDPNTHCLDGYLGNGTIVCNAGMYVQDGVCNCAPGFYGPQCTKCADKDQQPWYTHCVDGVNGSGQYVCDTPLVMFNGMCSCPTNSTGIGRYCNQTCSNCPEETAVCNPGNVTATCDCKPNFYRAMNMNSSDCNCLQHVYGSNCTSSCSSTCFDRVFGRCNDGYLGTGECNCGTHRYINTTTDLCQCDSLGMEGYHCDLCQPGTANGLFSQAYCSACQPGTFASLPGQSSCLTCTPGSIANSTNATSCWPCPIGSHSVNGTSCVACDAGSYADVEGLGQCIPCQPGTAVNTSGAGQCNACGEGTSASTTGFTSCVECVPPTGTNVGATGTVDCTSCSTGKALSTAGVCRDCLNGQFSNTTGLTQCYSCSAGRFTANDSTAHSYCLPCNAGTFSPYGSSSCTPCAQGTYGPSTVAGACLDCPSGAIAPSTGYSACSACSTGKYKFSSTVCSACLPGKASSTPGSDACTDCQSGTFAAGLENTQCNACPDGSFSNTTLATSCLQCAPGFTTNAVNGRIACIVAQTAEQPRLYSKTVNRTSVENATVQISAKQRFEFTVHIAGDLTAIANLDAYMGQLAYEIALVSNTTVDKVVITRVRPGSIIVDFSIPLTAAQILQQLVVANTVYNATTYPILSNSVQVVIPDLSTLVDPTIFEYRTNCTERTPFPGRSDYCNSYGRCRKGMCGCSEVDSGGYCLTKNLTIGYTRLDNVVCAQQGLLPDVCESQYTTGNAINYLDSDACENKHPKYRNVFPQRRYCQHMDYTLGNDAFKAQAVYGRVSSQQCEGCDGTELFLVYTLHFPSEPVPNTTSGFQLQQYAYVTNLYDGVQPIMNKRWAWVESRYKLSNNTYQLSRLVFLPGVEGEARRYYYQNDWRLVDCAGGEYAVGPGECVCQLNYVRHPLTGVCTQGCNNGLVGPECKTPISQQVGCQRDFNVFTAFISYDCQSVVCKLGAIEMFGVCVQQPSQIPFFITLAAGSSATGWTTITTIITLLASLTVVTLGVFNCWWVRKKCSKRRNNYRKVADKAVVG
jgi:hypothetical protein